MRDVVQWQLLLQTVFFMIQNRLKELRRARGKTQLQIAQVLGTTYQYYSTYEKGQRDLPLERAKKLAVYYNVSLDYLSGLSGQAEKCWLE